VQKAIEAYADAVDGGEDPEKAAKTLDQVLKKAGADPKKDYVDSTFRREWERTKSLFEDAYPQGVEYSEVNDPTEDAANSAFKGVDGNDIYLSMHNQGGDRMFDMEIDHVMRAMNQGGVDRNSVCRSGACYARKAGESFQKSRDDDDPTNDFLGRYKANNDRYNYGIDMGVYKNFRKKNPDAPIPEDIIDRALYGQSYYNTRIPKEEFKKNKDKLVFDVAPAEYPEPEELNKAQSMGIKKEDYEPNPIIPPQLAYGGFAPKRKPCSKCDKPKFFLGGLLGGGQNNGSGFFNMNSATNQNITGAAGGIGAIGGLAGGLIGGSKFGETGVGSALSGALSGAGAGASLGLPGMIGGALIGGIGSLIGRKKRKEEEEKQKALELEQKQTMMTANRYESDTGTLGTFPTEGVEAASYFAADGGMIMPEYEAEGGEVLEDPNQNAQAFSGYLEGLSSDMQKLNGMPHSQGGMDMEGGEFVYTKRWKSSPQLVEDLYNTTGIKFKKDTYAGLAETIGRKKGQVEQKLDSHDPASLNTANMMLERLEEGLELVKSEQEYRKMDKEYAT
jgi:hypothetical protein